MTHHLLMQRIPGARRVFHIEAYTAVEGLKMKINASPSLWGSVARHRGLWGFGPGTPIRDVSLMLTISDLRCGRTLSVQPYRIEIDPHTEDWPRDDPLLESPEYDDLGPCLLGDGEGPYMRSH